MRRIDMKTKFKNIILATLMLLLFVEVLIIFPSRLQHENEAEVRARVDAEAQRNLEVEGRLKRGEKIEEPSKRAAQSAQGIHFVESQQGSRDWEMFAVSAEGNEGASQWRLNQVKVYFYNHEKLEFTVNGDKGSIDSKSKDLSVVGNVITRSVNGYEFRSPSVFYISKKRLISGPENIIMKGPPDKSGGGIQLTGTGMQVNVDQSRMIIEKNVKAIKKSSDGKEVQIMAEAAEFSGKNNEAQFKGKVVMLYNGMKLEGPMASLVYDKGQNLLREISVSGGIKATDVDKAATSEKVVLDLLQDKYTFKGQPRVLHKKDELTGEEIVFLEGGKKVKVEKVRARVENKDQ